MICRKCGSNIPDGTYYCNNCGEPVEAAYNQQPFEYNGYNNANNAGQPYGYTNVQNNPFAPQYNPQAYELMIRSKIENAKTMGIIAIIVGLFIPLLGIVFGVIGIVKTNEINIAFPVSYDLQHSIKSTKKLCIAGIVVPIVIWVLIVLCYIVLIAAMGVAYDQLFESFSYVG